MFLNEREKKLLSYAIVYLMANTDGDVVEDLQGQNEVALGAELGKLLAKVNRKLDNTPIDHNDAIVDKDKAKAELIEEVDGLSMEVFRIANAFAGDSTGWVAVRLHCADSNLSMAVREYKGNQ